MKSDLRRLTVISLLLPALLGGGPLAASQLVLCRTADGHLALEPAHEGSGCPSQAPDTDDCEKLALRLNDSHCVDIPLVQTPSETVKPTKRAFVPSAVSAKSYQPSDAATHPGFTASAASPPSPGGILASLHTVRLII